MLKTKKLLALSLAMFFASSALSACDGGMGGFFTEEESENLTSESEDVSLDPNKTTIYIGNYYGGLGDAWLKDLCRKYEETHPDVQFKVDNDKTKFLLDNISSTVKSSRDALFFVEKIYYYDMVSQGLLADISDVVNSSLEEFGDTGTIADKLDNSYKVYLANNEVCDGKYYALPTYVSHHHMVYDVDLFEQKKLYISKNSTEDNIIWINGLTANTKSAGVDGVFGTIDDGLPVTWAQFQKLVEKMYSVNVTPFIWTGQYTDYNKGVMTGLWADYEGKANFELNYSFNGSAPLYGESSPVAITKDNAYRLQKQTGKKYALDFAKWISSDSRYYASSSSLLTSTHLEAQDEFIASRPSQGTNNVKPIGVIFEGDWWENEARENGDFTSMVNSYGEEYAYGTRRFSILPFPKTEGSNERRTIFSTSAKNAFFVNNKMSDEIKEIAKDFLKFCHTETSLQTFTSYTGVTRPFNYEITKEQYDSLTYYSKTLYDTYKMDNVDLVYDLPLCDTLITNAKYFQSYWKWNTNISGSVYDNPFLDFINDTELSSLDYFKGLEDYHKTSWSTNVK